MLNYPGINTWNTVEVQDTLLAVVKLDLPALDFAVKLLADLQLQYSNLSEKNRYTENPFDNVYIT
jgi:hypothetical protein